MTTFLTVFMQQPGAGGITGMLLPLGLMGIVVYFFMIRPQTKRAKDAKNFRESIKKGDRIITLGGIHGKITEIGDTTFIIETEGGGKLKIDKTAVSHETSMALNKPEGK